MERRDLVNLEEALQNHVCNVFDVWNRLQVYEDVYMYTESFRLPKSQKKLNCGIRENAQELLKELDILHSTRKTASRDFILSTLRHRELLQRSTTRKFYKNFIMKR